MNDPRPFPPMMSLEEIMQEADEHSKLMDRSFIFDADLNTLCIRTDGLYEVDLDRIQDTADLLSWVRHLLEKVWMNEYLMAEFIDRVEKIKGWRTSQGRMS
jgi:hypothetical protein